MALTGEMGTEEGKYPRRGHAVVTSGGLEMSEQQPSILPIKAVLSSRGAETMGQTALLQQEEMKDR